MQRASTLLKRNLFWALWCQSSWRLVPDKQEGVLCPVGCAAITHLSRCPAVRRRVSMATPFPWSQLFLTQNRKPAVLTFSTSHHRMALSYQAAGHHAEISSTLLASPLLRWSPYIWLRQSRVTTGSAIYVLSQRLDGIKLVISPSFLDPFWPSSAPRLLSPHSHLTL